MDGEEFLDFDDYDDGVDFSFEKYALNDSDESESKELDGFVFPSEKRRKR